jgi:L-rhamnose mutarotase
VRRVASVIRLRPEKEAEYRGLHAHAWPGVLGTLRAAHVTNYSIFLRDGLLFSYLEYTGDDYDADMARSPQTRLPAGGGSSATRASSLSTPSPTASGGHRPRKCSTWTDERDPARRCASPRLGRSQRSELLGPNSAPGRFPLIMKPPSTSRDSPVM